jgi:hypothetical protein
MTKSELRQAATCSVEPLEGSRGNNMEVSSKQGLDTRASKIQRTKESGMAAQISWLG